MKCQFISDFNDFQCCPYVTSITYDIKTMISWSNFLEKLIVDLKDKGYTFNQITEMHITTSVNKLDMPYDFYKKHYMQAVEWK